jgi:hypothetical protein
MTQLPITPAPARLWSEAGKQRDFPILEETRDLVRHALKSKKVSFDHVAPAIERDAALCLNLLQVAADQNPECLPQISGAASCLSLLGMQELVRLMKHLPVVERGTTDTSEQLYRAVIHTAGFAGNLAASWAQVRGNPSSSYARWATMLSSAPLLAWLRVWPQSGNWFYCLSEGDELVSAIRSVFGDDLKQWSLLARQLRLPQAAEDMFVRSNWPEQQQWRRLRRHDPRDLDNQRDLLHQCLQPMMIPLMAHHLAWHLHMSPEDIHTRRWTALVSHWLGKPQYVLQPQIRELQLLSSLQQHSSAGTGLHLLLSPHACRQQYPWIAPAEKKTVEQRPQDSTPKTAGSVEFVPADTRPKPGTDVARERHQDDDYMKKLLKQIQQEPDSFGDWHYLMRGMLRGVTEGIGLPSACIALLNKEKTALKVFYAEGMSEQAAMKRFIVDLRKPSIFNKLLEKPASLLLTPANRDKFLVRLPESVTQLLPAQTMMMSIDAGASPIGLVMGFGNEDQNALSQAEFIAFKNLCSITSQSLATLRASTLAKRPAAAQSRAPT